jgi:hypothetical protein
MVGIGCHMIGGSSGGPWILDYGNGNFLNGLNSSGRKGKDNEMLSPYFGSTAEGLYMDLINSTPGNPAG